MSGPLYARDPGKGWTRGTGYPRDPGTHGTRKLPGPGFSWESPPDLVFLLIVHMKPFPTFGSTRSQSQIVLGRCSALQTNI